MSRQRPLLVPAAPAAPDGPGGQAVHLRFDEALIEATAHDTLATALIAAGVLMTSRSPKYRRPRGPYCLTGDCGTCLVRIDGRPNVRACMTPVREGMRVSSQNSYRPKRLDPTQLVDTLFPGGIDHHHLMVRPRIVNQVMQEVARNLTGFGELPEGVDTSGYEYLAHELPVLIIGAGPAGQAAAAVFEAAGVDHVIVDRLDRAALAANLDDAESRAHAQPAKLLADTGVFGIYPGPHMLFPGREDDLALVAASERHPNLERLHAFRPHHLMFCVGSRDPMLPFPNNDLPGIVSARGLIRALRRANARIAGPCLVVGEGPWAHAQLNALDQLRAPHAPKLELIAPNQIERAVGGERIEALICHGGRRSCALLAIAQTPASAHELAAQIGVALGFNGGGFGIDRAHEAGDHGRCGALGGTSLWAAGDVCIGVDPAAGQAAAARDGARVAKAVLEVLAAAPHELPDATHFAPAEPPQPPTMRERPVVGDRFAEPAAKEPS
ncbi:Sarcosine oxidase alpha subunit [Enhygromyxa salina]|uniref:Sarcosine oxidase alpha subunit n=1 Tax=Enhygromyxa salina TaxID=215803 RepID=A0A0C1Z5N5_9BACT|nr:2Fe-2S iron-sulfur cluster-binding protein [Enhygromyxa salina]KIG12919.1 Sarcosine oxidase alpha subunit [Enhygromyxa salina]